jgi:hypothetical protein
LPGEIANVVLIEAIAGGGYLFQALTPGITKEIINAIRQIVASIPQSKPDFIPLNVSRNGGPEET